MNTEITEQEIQKEKEKTKYHIMDVGKVGCTFSHSLRTRLNKHDKSKLSEPEASMFAKHGKKLSELKYGTKEYSKEIEDMKKDCLLHHYKYNSNHPEHYENGVNDMNLIDIIEMLCDWIASCDRTKDGNFQESLKINMERFNIQEPLRSIILRSERYFYNIYIILFDSSNGKVIFKHGYSNFVEIDDNVGFEKLKNYPYVGDAMKKTISEYINSSSFALDLDSSELSFECPVKTNEIFEENGIDSSKLVLRLILNYV